MWALERLNATGHDLAVVIALQGLHQRVAQHDLLCLALARIGSRGIAAGRTVAHGAQRNAQLLRMACGLSA